MGLTPGIIRLFFVSTYEAKLSAFTKQMKLNPTSELVLILPYKFIVILSIYCCLLILLLFLLFRAILIIL